MIVATLLALALTASAQPSTAPTSPLRPPTRPPGHAPAPMPPNMQVGRPNMPPPPPPGKSSVSPENAPVERDLIFACGLSRMAMGIGNSPAFYTEKADLAGRIADAIKAGLRTKRVQDVLKTSHAAKDTAAKQQPWMDLAKSIGLDKWQCPSIETL